MRASSSASSSSRLLAEWRGAGGVRSAVPGVVATAPGVAGPVPFVGRCGPHDAGRHPGRRSAGSCRTTDSCAAAATDALPTTRMVGSPRSQAAAATCARASAYAWRAGTAGPRGGAGSPWAPRASGGRGSRRRRSPGWWRHRRPVPSRRGPGADSATAAARASASARAAASLRRRRSRPAGHRVDGLGLASRPCAAGSSRRRVRRAHQASRPAGGWRRSSPPASALVCSDPGEPGIGGPGAEPTSSAPPPDADPNFSARNLP